jgi:hypothetical protein
MSGPVREDEAALSSVLGAILLFGLLVSTLVTVQVQYVPVWDHQREGRLMDEMAGQLSRLQADLVHQVEDRTGGPAMTPLPLAPPSGFRFFTGSTDPGVLEFQPPAAGAGLTLSTVRLTLLDQSGADLYVLSEDWKPIVTGSFVPDIESIDHLRLRVSDAHLLADHASVTLTLKDDQGQYAGKLVLIKFRDQDEYQLRTTVYSAASQTVPITQVQDAWKKTTRTEPTFYLDVLDPQLGFTAVLAAASKPLNLTWASTMPTAVASLVHTSASTGSSGISGLVVPQYSHLTGSGRLAAARENQQFPAQRYVLEYGALIVEQGDGAAMVAPPAFSVRTLPGQVAVSWSVPELVGTPASAEGSRAAQVAAAPLGPRVAMRAFAPHLNFTLTTEHGDVWAAYWEQTLRDAGLGAPGGQYAITRTATSAKLQVFGPVSAPLDTATDDLFLQFHDATLALSLLPSG